MLSGLVQRNNAAKANALDRFRDLYKNAVDAQKKKILICAGTGCDPGGSASKIYAGGAHRAAERKGGVDCGSFASADEPHDADFHKGSVGVKAAAAPRVLRNGPAGAPIEPGGLFLSTKSGSRDCEGDRGEKTIIGDEYIADRLAVQAERRYLKTAGRVYLFIRCNRA